MMGVVCGCGRGVACVLDMELEVGAYEHWPLASEAMGRYSILPEFGQLATTL